MNSVFTSWTCLAALIPALLITESASAQKSATELERAKQQFEERTKAAFQSMDETFDKARAIAANRGDADLLKAIDKQKERMVRSRILPSVVLTAHFENDIMRAVVSIQKAYQRAITDATRSGEAQKASMLATELEKLVAPFHFDGRRCFRREGDAQYAVQPDDSWLETKARGQYVQFIEEKRTAEFIELKSKATDVRVRLYIDRVSLKHGYYPWGHFRNGAWVR